jgi:hypothetical protein
MDSAQELVAGSALNIKPFGKSPLLEMAQCSMLVAGLEHATHSTIFIMHFVYLEHNNFHSKLQTQKTLFHFRVS